MAPKSKKPASGSRVQLGTLESVAKKPLVSVARPPAFTFSTKGKEKEKPSASELFQARNNPDEDLLWIDKYEPQTEEELAVHKRKVEDVRRWFKEAFEGGPSGKLAKYRRILVLTGPAGTAKTTTIRILSRELGFDILEWRNPIDEKFEEGDFDRESSMKKFETFLSRASHCSPLLVDSAEVTLGRKSAGPSQLKKKVILLEDLPNILHAGTQASFHSALQTFTAANSGVPLVVIISDAVTRGERRDEMISEGRFGRGARPDVVDIRSVLPQELLHGPYVIQISFNPVAPTLMGRALQSILKRRSDELKANHESSMRQNYQPTKEELDIIIDSSGGDIRSAVMSLQFLCLHSGSVPNAKRKGRKKGGGNDRALLDSITRREQALALFHLLGKILYNKRKGDPPNQSASAKDKATEQELDRRLRDPPKLPSWLSSHERRASRVDVDAVYADSPVDTSLFSLYLHQNYPQFCDSIEECEVLCDWLSWVDSSGGESWHQANPHQFHLLALGALHSLPSPVGRRTQKMTKPAFFEVQQRLREAEQAADLVSDWLRREGAVNGDKREPIASSRVGAWCMEEVTQELPAVLKAISATGQTAFNGMPPSHALFSSLHFQSSSTAGEPLGDDATVHVDVVDIAPPARRASQVGISAKEEVEGQWLESDEIEEL